MGAHADPHCRHCSLHPFAAVLDSACTAGTNGGARPRSAAPAIPQPLLLLQEEQKWSRIGLGDGVVPAPALATGGTPCPRSMPPGCPLPPTDENKPCEKNEARTRN